LLEAIARAASFQGRECARFTIVRKRKGGFLNQDKSRYSWLSLRRVVAGGSYIPEIDGLRFIAVASVVIFHVSEMTRIHLGDYVPTGHFLSDICHRLLINGKFGVQIFFCVSGFVLGLPYARQCLAGGKEVKYGAYIKRRLTRLEPPYIAALLIRYKPVMAAKGLSLVQLFPHFLASLFYLNAVFYRDTSILMGIAWTLEVEVQFYLLAPLLAKLIFSQRAMVRRLILIALMVGSGILQLAVPDRGYLFVHSLLFSDQFFFAGFLLVDLYLVEFPKLNKNWGWDLVPVLLGPIFYAMSDHPMQIAGPAVLLLVGIAAFKGPAFSYFLSRVPVTVIGGMCYSLYLTHSLVVQGAYTLVPKIPALHPYWRNVLAAEVVCLPIALFFGICFFLLLERPCMDKNWPQKLAAWVRGLNPFRRTDEKEAPASKPEEGISVS
jgi:peptidoglycan/LPS O-acetylase OafA/YrhL